MKQILLVEDERDIADLLSLHLADLADLDAQVTHAADGRRGLTLALQQKWDLIVLDLTLPHCSGLDICQQVRQINGSTPIIILTARSSERERIAGLEAGADDYITKPFSISELVARVKAMFRRVDAWQDSTRPHTLEVGDITMCPIKHTVSVNEKPVTLTAKEFDLLLHFMRAPNRVFKRTELLEDVWGYTHSGYLHTVNSHINRLRAKIEPDPSNPRYISTVWGVGYRMSVETAE